MAYVSWFTIQHEVAYGSGLWVVGSCRCMGSWNVYEAHPLQWRPGHVWSCRVRHQDECVFDGGFEYKYIEWHRHQDDAPQWESRQNRRLELPAEDEAHTGTRVVKTNDRWDSDFTIREFTLFPPSYVSVRERHESERDSRVRAHARCCTSSYPTDRSIDAPNERPSNQSLC